MTSVNKLFLSTDTRKYFEFKDLVNKPQYTGDLLKFIKDNELFIRAYSGKVSTDYSTPLIPTETANFFYDRIYWENKLRNIVTSIPMPRQTFRIQFLQVVYLKLQLRRLPVKRDVSFDLLDI